MSIETLNTLDDARGYLRQVEATPYPLKEKRVDLAFFSHTFLWLQLLALLLIRLKL